MVDSNFSFSVEGRNIRVVALVDADEFLFFRDRASELGISQSSLLRQLINSERKRIAQEELSAHLDEVNSACVAQPPKINQVDDVFLTALASLLKPKLGIE